MSWFYRTLRNSLLGLLQNLTSLMVQIVSTELLDKQRYFLKPIWHLKKKLKEQSYPEHLVMGFTSLVPHKSY